MTAPTPFEVKMALLKMTQLLDDERVLHAKTQAERDQARQMLADAPHDANTCATWWGPQSAVCTCWKAGL